MANNSLMDDDYTTPTRRGSPLIQAALALLVASTLVAFSALAFRMDFGTDRGGEVTVMDAGRTGGAVVLPSFQRSDRSPRDEPEDGRARIAITTASEEVVVLGTRVDASTASSGRDVDRHEKRRGAGHDKARGRGHDKDQGKDKDKGDGGGWDGRSTTAREEEDDDYDDHGDDDASDDSDRSGSRSDASRSGKRHRKHRGGSGGHSRGHSRGSNSN